MKGAAVPREPGWPGRPGSAGSDGFLRVRELFGLDLVAELVVLSGCSTGRGRLVEGEGVEGLRRAFLAAGARTLVVSLWAVDDPSLRMGRGWGRCQV